MRIDPRLNGFLEDHGLGRFRPETAKEKLGRNSNFLVVTTTGRALFVKRIHMGSGDAAERFRACTAFEDLRRDDSGLQAELQTVPLTAHDEELGFLAYEAVSGAKSLAELAAEEDDDSMRSRAVELGTIVAALHRLDADRVPARAHEPHLPPTEWLNALPWRVYQNSSAPALQIWNRLQSDAEVAQALRQLRQDEREAPTYAVHGDVRLDQFLVGDDEVLRLVDQEEFRRGDIARDVGAMVGEWLHRATLDLLGDRSSDDAGAAVEDLELSHEEVVASGAVALDRRRPMVTAFWEAYRAAGGGTDDPEFIDRVTRFAGWHMFDRLVAASENTSRISALHWGAAGIGRQALLNPRAAAPALGLPLITDTDEEDAA